MKPITLDFYFDYLSPFAFFAWLRAQPLCEKYQVELVPHPVVFGKLLDHWGQLGPAEIPPKSQWVAEFSQRYASLYGFVYDPPQFHPFNPLQALRLSLKEVSGDKQKAVIQAIFEAGWTRGKDLGDLSVLTNAAHSAGMDVSDLANRLVETDIKQALFRETADAIAKGVFGVPTMIVNNRLFWGSDQFEHIELLLQGKDPLDDENLKPITNRARAIDRKAVS